MSNWHPGWIDPINWVVKLQTFCYFHPETWGRFFYHFGRSYFSIGLGNQPPTNESFCKNTVKKKTLRCFCLLSGGGFPDLSQELNRMKNLHGVVGDTVSDGTCNVCTYMNAVKTHPNVGQYTIKGSYSVCVYIYYGGRTLFQHCCGGIRRGLSTVQLEPTLLSQNLLLGRSGYRERRTRGHWGGRNAGSAVCEDQRQHFPDDMWSFVYLSWSRKRRCN